MTDTECDNDDDGDNGVSGLRLRRQEAHTEDTEKDDSADIDDNDEDIDDNDEDSAHNDNQTVAARGETR